MPVGDGTYVVKEMPGPQNMIQWLLSWKVYKVALIMLDVGGITGVAAALRKDGGALGDAFGGSSPTGGGAASNAATEANAIPVGRPRDDGEVDTS